MKTRKDFDKVVMPAKASKDGITWEVPFTKEQYDNVIDYLFTIGMFNEELERTKKDCQCGGNCPDWKYHSEDMCVKGEYKSLKETIMFAESRREQTRQKYLLAFLAVILLALWVL